MDALSTVPIWQIFLAIGLVLTILEVFVSGFVLLPMGLGFVLATPFLSLSDSFTQQLIILVISEIVVLFIFNKFVKPKLYSEPTPTNADSMIGKEVEVIAAISAGKRGSVKLYGDNWTALSEDDSVFAVGETAIIVKLDGNKAIITKKK